MAGDTGNSGVRSGQRELRVVVIERRWLPGCRVVAGSAIMIEVVLHMIGIRRRRKL